MQPKLKFAVYTVLTGDVHGLIDPFPTRRDDYARICFTTDPAIRSDAWEVRVFEGHDLEPERESRRPKLLPHRFLAEFDWSLYVDNRLRFLVEPLEILESYQAKGEFVCFRHPSRDCAFDEAEVVIRRGYDKEWRVREQMDKYRKLGFPAHAGLAAGTMLLRRHGAPAVVALDEEWYDHVLRFSRRDQLSFNFCAWRRNFRWAEFDGSLRKNRLMKWPCVPESERIPASFDEDVYTWLNPEVLRSGLSPRQHYLKEGRRLGLSYRRPPRDLNRLANKYRSERGDLYYDANGYADVYEHYLDELRSKPIRLLEIGLSCHDVRARKPGVSCDEAPSLSMWRDYFDKASLIGFDGSDFSRVPPIPGCRILRGDMGVEADLRRAVEAAGGQLDVIIAGAGHPARQQQLALGALFQHLRKGGLYFVEDLRDPATAQERQDGLLTRHLLGGWSQGTPVPSEHISMEAQAQIIKELDFVRFYDSQHRFDGAPHPRSIAVLRKRDGLLGRLTRLVK